VVAVQLPRLIIRAVLVAVGLTLIASVALDDADAGVDPGEFVFGTALSPPVPSQISVDGVPRDTWGLRWLALPPGEHELSFSDVPGYLTPASYTFVAGDGGGMWHVVSFLEMSSLRVTTEPPVDASIFLDGVSVDQWGLWTFVEPGAHEVCFGDVAGFVAPECQAFESAAGESVVLTGAYTPSDGAPGPLGLGRLRVVSDPPVPTTVLVDGVRRSDWGLTWLALAPGEYTVGFTDVPGFGTPDERLVTVVAGETTTVVGTFDPLVSLRVSLEPSEPLAVVVNGVDRNRWGLWTEFPQGEYEVCLDGTINWSGPDCQVVQLEGPPVHITMEPVPIPPSTSSTVTPVLIAPTSGLWNRTNGFLVWVSDNLDGRVLQLRVGANTTEAQCDPFGTIYTTCSIRGWAGPVAPSTVSEPIEISLDGGPWHVIGSFSYE